jgi:hypothetical protein
MFCGKRSGFTRKASAGHLECKKLLALELGLVAQVGKNGVTAYRIFQVTRGLEIGQRVDACPYGYLGIIFPQPGNLALGIRVHYSVIS